MHHSITHAHSSAAPSHLRPLGCFVAPWLTALCFSNAFAGSHHLPVLHPLLPNSNNHLSRAPCGTSGNAQICRAGRLWLLAQGKDLQGRKPPPSQSAQRSQVKPIGGLPQQSHTPGLDHNKGFPVKAQAALHPTPATLGRPRQAAQAALQRLESFDRGLYAGPFGWLSGDAAEFAVAIRSALLHAPGTCPHRGPAILIGGLVLLWTVPMCLKVTHIIRVLSAC